MLLRRLSRHVQNKIKEEAKEPKPAGRKGASKQFDPARISTVENGMFTALLNKADAAPEENRDLNGSEFVHLSSLIHGLCPRQVRFADETPDRKYSKNVQGAMRIVWALGRAAEKHVRDGYVAVSGRKGMLGVWKCKCEHTQVTGLYDADVSACVKCGGKADQYHELTLKSRTVNITGNPDMLIFLGGKLYVVEIKSINAKDFEALTAPKADHVLQGSGYRRLLKENGYDVADEVIIIYVNKDFKFSTPYKDYVVPPSASVEKVLDTMWAKAKLVKDARENNTRPARTMCQTAKSEMAKACPFVADCFGRR